MAQKLADLNHLVAIHCIASHTLYCTLQAHHAYPKTTAAQQMTQSHQGIATVIFPH